MVELIPKKIPKLPNWLNILFYVSLLFLVLSISSYFVLNHFLKESRAVVANLNQSLETLESSENLSLREEVLGHQKRIKDFSYLMSTHLESSNVFTFLEQVCHPRVQFDKFDLDSRTAILKISGTTQSFETLGQQLIILRGESLVENVTLSKLSMGRDGGVSFDLSILLKSQTLKPQYE